MSYRVEVERRAAKEFSRLSRQAQERLRPVIMGLGNNPRPRGAKKLSGRERGLWRIRVGGYRVVYEIGDDRVLVVRVRQRGEAYR